MPIDPADGHFCCSETNRKSQEGDVSAAMALQAVDARISRPQSELDDGLWDRSVMEGLMG